MATFPSLTPSARAYIPGDYPGVMQSSLAGSTAGFRRGNRRVGQTMQLSFQNLTEAQVAQITGHYDGQQGSYQAFFLSTECWAGMTTPFVPLLSDFGWLYAGAPTIADGFTSRWNVELELISVPINTGDLVFDGQDASDTWTYILEAEASSTAARDYIISPPGAF